MSADSKPKTVVYRVLRFEPDGGSAPRWQEYTIPHTSGLTVLDGLWVIKEEVDPTLVWRSSCRMGICGSCGMFVNGLPRLACNTQISELGSTTVEVAPLPNFDTLRDLVPDLGPMFDHHQALSPYILRRDGEEREKPTAEYYQSSAEMERYLQFSYCIKCASCIAACPTAATDPVYSGPMSLAQAQRYNTDTRDDGFDIRKLALRGEKGPWRCHFAGECSRVCPKGVDPAKAIQLLRRDLVADYLRLRRSSPPAEVVKKPEGIERRPGIAEAPPPTV
jgi:succinate dehydrogenase / fumarate reductase iron-sulfur subunit